MTIRNWGLSADRICGVTYARSKVIEAFMYGRAQRVACLLTATFEFRVSWGSYLATSAAVETDSDSASRTNHVRIICLERTLSRSRALITVEVVRKHQFRTGRQTALSCVRRRGRNKWPRSTRLAHFFDWCCAAKCEGHRTEPYLAVMARIWGPRSSSLSVRSDSWQMGTQNGQTCLSDAG